MPLPRYLRVTLSDPSGDEETNNKQSEQDFTTAAHPLRNQRRRLQLPFILSIVVNIFLVSIILQLQSRGSQIDRSKFAGLTRTVPKPWGPNEAINDTEQDALWESTSYDAGNIALSDTYAREAGLPRAQRFPWDQAKGIYLINAYHNLHCVKTLRTALVEFRDGREQSSPWGHLAHCLLVLRDELICEADDTPRYTGFQPNQKSGLGQVRMCRDFEQLERWALDNTACWRHVGEIKEEGFRELDRYRFCPEGGPYKEMSESLWLQGDWWRKYRDE
ncbi:hypothetical protein BDV41DRAFT_571116 [Aspergillus transmontanensis]|uniref:Tat pathway signal sequence n=1 Tax=Aspergillus transmontanensis TaxID=1034304 RepID=A0A5N6WFA1_9EURO|nr:hypothetical protein BDV41DRAFT_571116 [Aspergillus transmontanensis]